MILNIAGIDKAELLVALYNNARNSLNAQLIQNFLFFLPKYTDSSNQLSLEKAQALLRDNSYIDFIGAVGINIDFSTNEINTHSYDVRHHTSGATLAIDIVEELRCNSTGFCFN